MSKDCIRGKNDTLFFTTEGVAIKVMLCLIYILNMKQIIPNLLIGKEH